jgi:signal transduction histidine kinase
MLLGGDAGQLTEEQNQYVGEIQEGNKRMVDLVVSLLNVSRIDLGTFTIDPQPINLTEVCESVLKDLSSQIQPRHTKIVKQFDSDLPIINADANLMRIVFQNLLSNAVKYTREGGEVKVAISKQPSHILIQVSDNGLGIPTEQQERIFSKFFRADNARTEVTDGNGLGLHIVRAALETAGGKIWFTSEENKGTTFYITLPLEGMKKKKGTKALQLMGNM